MKPGTFNLPQQYGNDTSEELSFGFNFDLTGVDAEMTFSLNRTKVLSLEIGDGLTLSGNTIIVAPFDVPNPSLLSETYFYELKLRFPSGAKKTYMTGEMPVLRDRS